MDTKTPGPFQLPALPWDENALAPVISARTIALHYGKHHLAYVKKLNELVAGTRFAELPLEHVIAATVGGEDRGVLRRPCAVPRAVCQGCGGMLRQRLGVARRARRQARDPRDLERGHADHEGRGAAAHDRRVGARYYLDYENRRPEFVDAVIDQLLNWDFTAGQLEKASSYRKAA